MRGRTRHWSDSCACDWAARARVRELHVYGPMVPIGSRAEGWQHRGYGARLVQAAETLAEEAGYELPGDYQRHRCQRLLPAAGI